MSKKLIPNTRMTGQEIADWMGIAYSTYRRNPTKRQEVLVKYAKFTVGRGYVDIEEVYQEEYINGYQEKMDEAIFLMELMETENGLSSLSAMAHKIHEEGKYFVGLTESAIKYHLRNSKNILFNKPVPKGVENSGGTVGKSEYVWAIKVDAFNNYRYMNEKEEQVFYALVAGLPDDNPTFDLKELALFTDALMAGEITREEFDKHFGPAVIHGSFRNRVIFPFRDKTGQILVRATKHQIEESLKRQEAERIMARLK